MKCESVEGLLSAYHDSALDAPLQREVADHLHTCAHCAAVLSDYERFDTLLTDLPRVEPSPELRDRIFSAPEYLALLRDLDREQARGTDHPTVPAPAISVSRRAAPAWRRALLPAAAALLLATGGGLLAHNGFRASTNGPGYHQGMPAYGNPGNEGIPLAAGNRVVYLRGGRLWSAAESGNQAAQALTPAGEQVVAWAAAPKVAAGGATLVAYVDSHGVLSVIRADGQSNQVVFRPGADGQPGPGFWSTPLGVEARAALHWSPDGQQLSYVALTGNGQTALSVVDAGQPGTVHTISSEPITSGAIVGNITWAPDSAHVAYTQTTTSGTSLWVYDRTTQDVTEVATLINPSTPTAQVGQLAWAGDVRHLAVTWSATTTHGVSSIYTWSAADYLPSRLYATSTADTVAAYSSAADEWLVGEGTHLVTISLSSGAVSEAGMLDAPAAALTWNAQGTAAAILSGDSLSLWTPNTPPTMLAQQVDPAVVPAWAPDGHSLAYATTSGVFTAQVTIQNGSWTTSTHKAAGTGATTLAWAPDGQGLAIAQAHAVAVLAASGTTRVVDTAPADSGTLAWTVAG